MVLADRLQIKEVTRACMTYILTMMEEDIESSIAMCVDPTHALLLCTVCSSSKKVGLHVPRNNTLI